MIKKNIINTVTVSTDVSVNYGREIEMVLCVVTVYFCGGDRYVQSIVM